LSEPSKPADSGNKPLDLKSRLSLKTQAAAKPAEPAATATAAPTAGAALPPPPQPVLPPPPVQKPKVESPTAETIAEARRRAEVLAAEAGPAAEEFSIGGAPDRTPVPQTAPGGVRVEYVNVEATEVSPEVRKKNRMVLIGAVVIAALVAFFLGKALSSAGALSELKENMIAEAQDKLRFLEGHQSVADRIKALAADVKAFNAEAAAVQAGQKSVLDLEEPMANLIAKVNVFVNPANKSDVPFIAPSIVLGGAVYNGELTSRVLEYAVATQNAYLQAQSMLEEAMALVAMWRPVVGDARTVRIFSDVEEIDHPEGGKMPRGKGSIITKYGPPTKVDVPAADGRPEGQEFQQMIVLAGATDPIQVKTTQVTWTDLGAFFDDQLKGTKAVSLGRLAVLTERLQKTLEACKPEGVKTALREWLVKAGVTVDGAAAPSEASAAPAPADPAPAPAAEKPPTP
jgi:hypothetical protein